MLIDGGSAQLRASRFHFLRFYIDACKHFAKAQQDSGSDVTAVLRVHFQTSPALDFARRPGTKKGALVPLQFRFKRGLILAQMVDWSDHYVKVIAHSNSTCSKQAISIQSSPTRVLRVTDEMTRMK
jgi:hypothetical protein